MDKITLRKIVAKEDRKLLREMCKNYLADLSRYRDLAQDDEEIKDACCEAGHRRDFFITLDNKPIGFVMLGDFPNSFSKHDLYIQEFFIKNEYRQKGYGREAVKRITETFKDFDFSLFIIEKNSPAIRFWDTVFMQLSYENRLAAANVETSTWDHMTFRYFTYIGG